MRRKSLLGICIFAAIPAAVQAQPAPIPYSVDTHIRSASPTIVVPKMLGGAATLDVQTQRPEAGPYVSVEKIERPNSDGSGSNPRDTISVRRALSPSSP